ncbi:hypothetical protein DM01DRAFT_1320113 [Hesseltinella vesiculosa]|uniref:VASt domain-containing protein n=1 Tax=Hesseltinella vesiculosa TaxID=101127 RepID=A0A1X2GM15_9FUNG|nr:hypothetical protein DM01DRAFT_1320113 [Hesseltinella vesiculosa]
MHIVGRQQAKSVDSLTLNHALTKKNTPRRFTVSSLSKKSPKETPTSTPRQSIASTASQPLLSTTVGYNSPIKPNATPAKNAHRVSTLTMASTDSEARSTLVGSIASAVGVDVASNKRNVDFHALFRSVPDNELLIEDFGCALQKEILVQGRLYISENYLCFNANIFGWVTNLVIAFEDIVDIEKRTTALFIPNAIQVSTLHAKHFFTSFLSRDQAWELMMDVWKYSRTLHGQAMSGTIEKDKNSNENQTITDAASVYSNTASVTGDSESDHSSDDQSESSLVELLPISSEPKSSLTQSVMAVDTKQAQEVTTCTCQGDHYEAVVMDTSFKGSLESIYNLLYNSSFLRNFLINKENSSDLVMSDWENAANHGYKRTISYIKPLNGPIGPKQTKCNQEENVLCCNFKQCACILTTTTTPDVPSGGAFSVKTKTCMTWSGYHKVRILVTCKVEFTKSSWLKSTIERASLDGQTCYYKDMDAAIKSYIRSHSTEFASQPHPQPSKHRPKKKKHHRKHEDRDKPLPPNPWPALAPALAAVLAVLMDTTRTAFHTFVSAKSSSRVMLVCLVSMMVLNLFIASKIGHLESKLAALSADRAALSANDQYLGQGHGGDLRLAFGLPIDDDYDKDDLWDWLTSFDHAANYTDTTAAAVPPSAAAMASIENQVYQAHPDDAAGQRLAAMDKLLSPERTKQLVEHNLRDLSRMIRRAERTLGHVSRNFHQQRDILRKDLAPS